MNSATEMIMFGKRDQQDFVSARPVIFYSLLFISLTIYKLNSIQLHICVYYLQSTISNFI